ncbi:hypothetical protein T484DRAFT_1830297 [Baffinella frigidus]|nr:hypothetical protein T484DRAFT_1830297 [Cryptophyta sp. CCMP2293]
MDKATERYIYILVALGAWSALANVLGYCGACAGSRTCLTLSCWSLALILVAEGTVALILIFDPALINSAVTALCPTGDAACIDKIGPSP